MTEQTLHGLVSDVEVIVQPIVARVAFAVVRVDVLHEHQPRPVRQRRGCVVRAARLRGCCHSVTTLVLVGQHHRRARRRLLAPCRACVCAVTSRYGVRCPRWRCGRPPPQLHVPVRRHGEVLHRNSCLPGLCPSIASAAARHGRWVQQRCGRRTFVLRSTTVHWPRNSSAAPPPSVTPPLGTRMITLARASKAEISRASPVAASTGTMMGVMRTDSGTGRQSRAAALARLRTAHTVTGNSTQPFHHANHSVGAVSGPQRRHAVERHGHGRRAAFVRLVRLGVRHCRRAAAHDRVRQRRKVTRVRPHHAPSGAATARSTPAAAPCVRASARCCAGAAVRRRRPPERVRVAIDAAPRGRAASIHAALHGIRARRSGRSGLVLCVGSAGIAWREAARGAGELRRARATAAAGSSPLQPRPLPRCVMKTAPASRHTGAHHTARQHGGSARRRLLGWAPREATSVTRITHLADDMTAERRGSRACRGSVRGRQTGARVVHEGDERRRRRGRNGRHSLARQYLLHYGHAIRHFTELSCTTPNRGPKETARAPPRRGTSGQTMRSRAATSRLPVGWAEHSWRRGRNGNSTISGDSGSGHVYAAQAAAEAHCAGDDGRWVAALRCSGACSAAPRVSWGSRVGAC